VILENRCNNVFARIRRIENNLVSLEAMIDSGSAMS